MPVSCTPSDLAAAAKCYCFDKETTQRIKLYLLAVIADKDDLDPEELDALAKCYCFSEETAKRVENYLLCQIADALGA